MTMTMLAEAPPGSYCARCRRPRRLDRGHRPLKLGMTRRRAEGKPLGGRQKGAKDRRPRKRRAPDGG